MGNKKLVLIISLILLLLNFCKGQDEKTKNISINKDILYNEILNYNKNSDYDSDIKILNISYKGFLFNIKYIEEKAFLEYKVDNSKIVKNDMPLKINFYYDSDCEIAEKDIHLLYNEKLSSGYILLPSFSEEMPTYFLYKFDKNNFKFLGDYELNNRDKIKILNSNDSIINGIFSLYIKNTQENLVYEDKKGNKLSYNKRTSENENRSEEGLTIPNKWIGTYSESFRYANLADNDPRLTENIEIAVKSDSVIFTVDSYWGQYQYNLLAKENNKGLKLVFDKSLYFQLQIADKDEILEKTKDFGILYYDGRKYIWTSPYIDEKYNAGKKKNYILKKNK